MPGEIFLQLNVAGMSCPVTKQSHIDQVSNWGPFASRCTLLCTQLHNLVCLVISASRRDISCCKEITNELFNRRCSLSFLHRRSRFSTYSFCLVRYRFAAMRFLARTFERFLSTSRIGPLDWGTLDRFLRPLRDVDDQGPSFSEFLRLHGRLGLAVSTGSAWEEAGLKIGDRSTVLLRRLGATDVRSHWTPVLDSQDAREISDRFSPSYEPWQPDRLSTGLRDRVSPSILTRLPEDVTPDSSSNKR